MKSSGMLAGFRSAATGCLLGLGTIALVVLLITALIAAVSVVLADESVRTYPARLGEQDRSLNYPIETTEHLVEYHAVTITDGVETLHGMQCQRTNMYLLYMMKDIAAQIAKHPDLGYLYKGALLAIRESWCND